jgi:hypothetical protein
MVSVHSSRTLTKTLTKSHESDWLHMSWAKTTTTDMLMWMTTQMALPRLGASLGWNPLDHINRNTSIELLCGSRTHFRLSFTHWQPSWIGSCPKGHPSLCPVQNMPFLNHVNLIKSCSLSISTCPGFLSLSIQVSAHAHILVLLWCLLRGVSASFHVTVMKYLRERSI